MTNEERIEKFKNEKIAIHCETEEEAKSFVRWCYLNGMIWTRGKPTKTFYDINKNDTCYVFSFTGNNCLGYSCKQFYKEEGYEVIKYKDFMKGETNMIKVKDIAEKYGEYEIDENKLKKLLVEPKPKSIWDLKLGDTYYCISEDGFIFESKWNSDGIDNYRRAAGNCFLTHKEAEFEDERKKVETLLLRYGGTRDMMSIGCLYDEKYYIYYNNYCKHIEVSYNCCDQEHNIYFKSRKDCWDAIEKIGIDRIKKYLFHVEEGNKND